MHIPKKALIASVFLIFVLFGATLVYAQGGEIHACVNSYGKIHIVEDSSSCLPQEELLTWNIQGPQGDKGDTGAQGPTGPAGLSGYEIVELEVVEDISEVVGAGGVASCPEGKKVLGGGGEAKPLNLSCSGGIPNGNLLASRPSGDAAWHAELRILETGSQCTGTVSYTFYAVCANVED